MNKSSSSQANNAQIILAHGAAPDQPSIESESYSLSNKNLRQRTISTENKKYLFNDRSSVNRNANASNQLTFQSSKIDIKTYIYRQRCK